MPGSPSARAARFVGAAVNGVVSLSGSNTVSKKLTGRSPRASQSIFEALEPRKLMSVNVTTYHYNNAQTGANTNETALTLANVNTSDFGKIASMAVDGQIYAQPLVLTAISTPSYGTRDIVFVATENDTVYAFDAEGNNPAQGYLWKTSLLQNGEVAVPQADYGTNDITNTLGITGTPVIDPTTGTLYVVGFFKETNASYTQRIYALNVATGASRVTPVTIATSVAGTGSGSSNGIVAFDPYRENQRPALTLANGEVYVGYSSHGDEDPWHGWLLGFNASTLHLDYTLNDTPNGDAGGIWMSGGGIAVDSAGNLYFSTGNGDFDANTGGSEYGMAIEKVSPSLQPLDYFTPYNWQPLSNADLDYGCSSVILISNQTGVASNEILTESKWGTMYLNNSNTGSMGEFTNNGPNKDLGEGNITTNLNTSNVHQTMAYWNGHAYIGGDALKLQMFNVSNSALSTTEVSQTAKVFGNAGAEDGQGVGVSVSSNGSSNGILWALDNSGFTTSPAVLYAYNASNLGQLLWSSNMASNNLDAANNAVKFTVPVVANGYVYTAGAGSITVFGLKTPSTATPTIVTPAAATPANVTGTTTSLSVTATDPAADLHPTYSWVATNSPAGSTTPTFSVNNSNSAYNPTVTFYAAGAYAFTVTIQDPNSGLTATSAVNVTVTSTLTGLTLSPTKTTLFDGNTQQFTATSVDQFGNALTNQPNFTWAVTAGGVGGSVSATGLYTAPANGNGTDTVTATSGSMSASSTISVVPSSSTIPVDLSASDDRVGVVTDGVAFAYGLDGGAGLSETLVGTSPAWNGSTFSVVAPGASNSTNDVVAAFGQTIPVSQNRYSMIKLLATRTNGNVAGETITFNYVDGSTQTVTQGFSDWYTPQNYTGESIAIPLAYRDNSDGSQDTRPFNVYGYRFSLNTSVALKSITIPNDGQLNFVAIDLVGVPSTGVPAVTTPAAANPSSASGTTTILSVLGTDPAGDAAPTYTWSATNVPSGAIAPTFSVNGTAAANTSTATFFQAGAYTFTATITDPSSGLVSSSSVNVTVTQTVSGITVSPATPTIGDGTTQQFTATAVDQFGKAVTPAPAFTWSIVGNPLGTINGTGLYQAPAVGTGTVTVQAAVGTVTGQTTATISNMATATFYPTLAGWWRAGIWQATSPSDGGTNFATPAGGLIISKNPAGGTLRDAYLKFNISNAAFAGDVINSVTLTFNAAAVNQPGPVGLGVYGVSNTTWGATTADPSPAPNYSGATLIGSTQNVGSSQGSFGSYTFNLGTYITNTTNGLISFELNSPAATNQETGISLDAALNTPGVDPVITINYSIAQPAWLGSGSAAVYNSTTKILTVTGPTTIIADPGTDAPIIQANGSSAVVTINPTGSNQIHIGGLTLTNGASAVVASLGSARTATNHRVLVLGLPGATTAPTLSIDATSVLDLADNDLVDHTGSLSAVTSLIKTGLNLGNGYWNGQGITSSNAAAGTLFSLGDKSATAAGTFDSETVGTGDVEVRYTYAGDANLDGKIDGSDYSKIDAGYSAANASGWSNGDFNYDGVIDGSDYTLIDNGFNNQAAVISSTALIATSTAQVAVAPVTVTSKPVPTVRYVPTLFSSKPLPLATFAARGGPGPINLVAKSQTTPVKSVPATDVFPPAARPLVVKLPQSEKGDVSALDPATFMRRSSVFAG